MRLTCGLPRWLWAVALLLALGGCEQSAKPAFRGSDLAGADFGRQLALTDHNGRAVTLETFKGKSVVLFFGYVHCPDVCPTTLTDMAEALKLMPRAVADKVQVLFVTVDPERDTPDVLKTYVPYFHPAFLGLHGSPAKVAKVANEFRVVYRRHVEPGASDYLVDHSAGSFVLDGHGRLRLYLPYGHSPEDIAHDLLTLLKADSA
ncbi:MAG: SCO family protein [Pseudomonadota bacterium]|nr:SCO family protein [Pseudomonadota bacterium]MDP1905153.1 SCO family protein [Pseudomonadota bacterium]MDP2351910.1 SCO family protein [Pseudomonadota bacterium]